MFGPTRAVDRGRRRQVRARPDSAGRPVFGGERRALGQPPALSLRENTRADNADHARSSRSSNVLSFSCSSAWIRATEWRRNRGKRRGASRAAGSPVEEHGDADLEEGPVDEYHVAAARARVSPRKTPVRGATTHRVPPFRHAKQALAGADARRSLPRWVSARLVFSDPCLRVFLVCL